MTRPVSPAADLSWHHCPAMP